MAERSEVVEEPAVRDGSAAYAVEPEITTAEDVQFGYKRTEVGVIPEDWEVEKIGNLKPFVTSGSRGWARFYSETGATFLRITNLTRQSIHLDLGELKFVELPFDDFAEANRTGVKDGDLLISITADIGVIGYVNTSVPKPAFLNQHLALVRFDPEAVSSKYSAYYLASERPQRLFLASMDVGAKAGMNLITIRKLQLVLPPLREQRAIATALSDADALIESLDRLIAKKRAIKQAAMQQLLTGQVRLPGFTGEWETKRLGDHVTFLKTGTNSRAELSNNGSVAYLHYGDIHVGGSVTLNPNIVSIPHILSSKVRSLDKLAPGDLVFVDASEDIEGVGKSVEIVDVPEGGMVAGLHTIAARFDKNVLADGFKAHLQYCPTFIETLRRLAAGTKVLATNRQHIASVEIELPGVAEQQAIASVLSDMDTELETLACRRDKARQIKQGMMQQLLTGRVRLIEPHTTEPAA